MTKNYGCIVTNTHQIEIRLLNASKFVDSRENCINAYIYIINVFSILSFNCYSLLSLLLYYVI